MHPGRGAGGEDPADAVAGPAAPAQAPRQAPVGHHPGKGRSSLQPESLQGAAEAEKDGGRAGKAAEEAHKAEGGRRTDAETGGTQEAPGAAEEVPGRP